MALYSQKSLDELMTCDLRLQQGFKSVTQFFDNKILCGHRGEVDQNAAFATGNSRVQWPDGRHNSFPSEAVDAVVYPVGTLFDKHPDPRDIQKQIFFAGYVKAFFAIMGIPLLWGGDWDDDKDLTDQTFNDLFHFELKK